MPDSKLFLLITFSRKLFEVLGSGFSRDKIGRGQIYTHQEVCDKGLAYMVMEFEKPCDVPPAGQVPRKDGQAEAGWGG